MTDDEWEKQRSRAVMAAFQTGRPVFADNDGVLRFTDGAKELVPADSGVGRQPVSRAMSPAARAERASHWAGVTSIVAAVSNTVAAIWHPWQLVLAAMFVGSAIVWRRVNQHQRAVLRGAS